MKILFKMMLVVSGLVLVGCGGGGGNSTSPTSQLDNQYEGKTQKAIIDEGNSLKFIRAANHVSNLGLTDIPMEGKNIEEYNHINSSTGLGYIVYQYNNATYNTMSLTGSLRVDVLEASSTKAKIKIEQKFIFSTVDNNISFHRIARGTIVATQNGEELQDASIEKYYIYDEKYKEHIEFLDFHSKPKLYVGSEGYVLVNTKSDDFIINGDNNTELKIVFKPEEAIYETRYIPAGDPTNGPDEPYQEKIYEPKKGQGVIENTLNGTKQANLYFVNFQVSEFEPPKFYESYGDASLLNYAFYSWHAQYKLLNEDTNNIHIEVEWFVNDIKVDSPVMYELPFGSFSEGDTVKVVVSATHGDITVKKEQLLEGNDNNYNLSSGIYEYPDDTFDVVYRTNNLTVDLNLLGHEYFKNIDVPNSDFSWNMLNIASCQPEDLPGGGSEPYGSCDYILEQNTKYQKIPRLKTRNYGSLYEPLYLMIYTGHEVKVVRFNITLMRGTSGIGNSTGGEIIDSIEEANLTNNTNYIATNKVLHLDIDNNGLDDIIYMSATDIGSFLNISYQNEKRVFTLEKIQNDGRLYLGDYDGDGVKEAFMFGATENASQLLSLEKSNLHVVKDVNLTNTMNILNVHAVADMNNNEKDDLIIANNQENKLYIYENLDDLTQKRLVGSLVCRGIKSIKDINSDGLKDVICKPTKKEIHDSNTGLFSSKLEINYFSQESNGTFSLNTREYTLIKDVSFSKVSQTRVYGATMLDETNIVVSASDVAGYTLYTCDLASESTEPKSKTATNSHYIDAFLKPTDLNNDGKNDLLSYRDYGKGELNVFYQIDNFSFDADYKVEMNTYNQLTDRFFRNAFLDDIDNDGSLEIVTVNGENKFSYINLK